MADKPKDSAKATWISRKFGAHADDDRLAPARRSLAIVGQECRQDWTSIAGGIAVCAAFGGFIGLLNPEENVPVTYSDLHYSDSGNGYEILHYAADRPAIGVVRNGETINLYTVTPAANGDQWTLVRDEREAWAFASEAYTLLTHNAELAGRPFGIYQEAIEGKPVFMPVLWRYDRVTKAWEENGLSHRLGEGRRNVDLPLRGLSQEYAAEAAEWTAVRGQFQQAGYHPTIAAQEIAAPQDMPNTFSNAVIGVGMGGAFGITLLGGLTGFYLVDTYRRQRRNFKKYGR